MRGPVIADRLGCQHDRPAGADRRLCAADLVKHLLAGRGGGTVQDVQTVVRDISLRIAALAAGD
jgi:hypothetical protein